MNNVGRIATGFALIAIGIGWFYPEYRAVAVAITVGSTIGLWLTREVAHIRNGRLRAQVVALGGTVVTIDGRVTKDRTSDNTAAAISGQGQLATWNYSTLVTRLKADGHIV